jgi:hypothetical protein
MTATMSMVAGLLGCTGAVESPPAPEPVAAPAPAPEPAKAVKGRKGKGKRRDDGADGAADPQPKIPATGQPDPLAGLSDGDVCHDNSLLLLKYTYAELQGGKCAEVCCAASDEHWCCGLDWPSSDVMTCSEYGYMRNAVFSRYGFPFTEAKWQEAFGDQPYYRRRDDFDASWLTAAATENVATLKRKEDTREACIDE